MHKGTVIGTALVLLIAVYVGSNGVSALTTLFDRMFGGVVSLLLHPPTATIPII